MIARVYKYKLLDYSTPRPELGIPVMLPSRARIIEVEFQDDVCYLWAIVDPENSYMAERRFIFVGTGTNFEEYNAIHLKTLHKNGFVFHVFEVTDVTVARPYATATAAETRRA